MSETRFIRWLIIGFAALTFAADNASAGRQYAPKAKRFMQRDPLVGLALARIGHDGRNAYSYIRASPVRFRDASGQDTCGDPPSGGFVGGLAGGWTACDENGTSQPCVPDDITDPCMRQCRAAHEQSHADECNANGGCPPCDDDVHRGDCGLPAGASVGDVECTAYTEQANCLAGCSSEGVESSCEERYVDCLVTKCASHDPGSGIYAPDHVTAALEFALCGAQARQSDLGCENYNP